MLCVLYHVLCVRCQVLGVKRQKKLGGETNWWSLSVEDLLSMGPTMPSFIRTLATLALLDEGFLRTV